MIRYPRAGQRVRLAYRASLRRPLGQHPEPPHGQSGSVLVAGRGPGPCNVLVRLDSGVQLVVPRGNLMAEQAGPQQELFR